MNNTIKGCLFAVVILHFCFSVNVISAENKLTDKFRIIPQPQKIEIIGGKGLDHNGLNFLFLAGSAERPVMGDILSRLTEANREGKTRQSGEKGGILTLKLDSSSFVPKSEEGYIMTISGGNAGIISRGEAGLFYGCQTLEQLLEDARDYHVRVPACRITDYPALSYRAVHFDVKHHLDNMDYYYRSIDRLARYKINAVIFEFEDKLRYQRQPLVGAPQAVSIDEMASLTRYARERHIEISPLVQGLGHATFILKHQDYAHLRELSYNRWAFCPLHEGTYQVLFDLYRDAMDATPGSKYIHVGGDEIGNIGLCPRCKPTADKEGMLSLNLYWLKRVCEFALEHGRIPIFWDDMPLKEAGVYKTTYDNNVSGEEAAEAWKTGESKLDGLIPELPENCVFMRWNYSMAKQPGNIMALDWYKKQGLKVMVATATQTSATLFPYDDRNNDEISGGILSIRSFTGLGVEKEVEGTLCTAWDDKSPHFETYWHGFLASAEYSWSPFSRSPEQFDVAWMQREFGMILPDYASLYAILARANAFWDSVFLRKGSREDIENALFNLPGLAHWMPPKRQGEPVKTDFTDVLIELPELKNPGKWSEQYSGRLKEAGKIIDEYRYSSKTLNELYHLSKRNRYHWEVFSALNDFQLNAPRLILALGQCDSDDKAKQKAGLEMVRAALNDFEKSWENLNHVYNKTRFIRYPDNYVPDRYFHFASQREDLSFIIQVEEMFHKMVRTGMFSEKQ